MKNKLLITSFAVILSIGVFTFALSSKNIYKNESPALAAQHKDNYDSYTYAGSYYSSIDEDATQGMSGTLRSSLTSLIHPTSVPEYSGTKTNSLAKVLQYADEDPTNSSNMVYLYTRNSLTKNAASSWNREHVWPKSLSNSCWVESRAGSDLLHLRPTYSTTNSKRSSDKFGAANNELTYNGMVYGKNGNGYFEPLDAAKGDVARICMYVWVAYHDEYGSKLPALTNVFKDFDTLMRWHVLDRPDVLEGNRNNYAQTSMQKNRNPFVDHPEYAWKIFGEQCSSDVLLEAMAAYPEGGSEVTLTSIAVSNPQTEYVVNETFKKPTVTAYFEGADAQVVTNACTFSGFDLSVEGEQTVQVSYTFNGVTKYDEYDIVVSSGGEDQTYPDHIDISEPETSYYIGDTFVKPTVTVTYNDETTADVTEKAVFSGYNLFEEGEYEVTVQYTEKGYSVYTYYTIEVYPIEISEVLIENAKTEYKQGDTFVKPTVKIVLTNSDIINVSGLAVFSGYDMSVAGTQTVMVSVTYGGETANTTYSITVAEYTPPDPPTPPAPEVLPVSLKIVNPVIEYTVGDTFVKPTVHVIYSDQSEADVTNDVSFSQYDLSKSGSQVVVVTYVADEQTSLMTTYQITVKKAPEPAPSSSGCGGSITTTSVILSTLSIVGVSLILIKKKKTRD